MFSFREFIKKGFLDAVGRMPDYWIIINAAGYYEKGVLTQEDLAEINAKIEAQYPQEPQEPQVVDNLGEIVEE